MPQVASNEFYKNATAGMGGEDIKSSVDFIDSWNQPEIRLSVIAFETNYKEASDSRLLPFKRRNVTYKNILEYIYRVSGYRGGVFSEEPNGERGNVNRLNQWSVKDAELDRRGDPLFEAVGQFFGTHIVVTTDRPDVWLQYSEIYKD